MGDRPQIVAASSVLNEARFDLAEFSGRSSTYFICATPRSGSTLLAFLLLGSGMMGVPHEYMNDAVHLPQLARRFGLVTSAGTVNLEAYLACIRRWRTSANGVFGIKLFYRELARLFELPSIAPMVEEARLIRIRRRDQIGQAISYFKAAATGFWSTHDPGLLNDRPLIEYNRTEIGRRLNEIVMQEMAYRSLFAARKLTSLEIWYEDMVANPDAVCKTVCRYVGVETAYTFDLRKARIQRLATARNEEWKQRFCAEQTLLKSSN